MQAQLAFQGAQTAALQGQATESQARAAKYAAEAEAVPMELEIDRVKAVTANLAVGDADDKEFKRRVEISKQLLKDREVTIKEQESGKAVTPKPTPQARPMGQPRPVPQPMQPNMGELQ
jgi:hypothetical protein